MADHKRNDDPARSRLLRPLAVLAAVTVTLVAFIGGCSGGDDDWADPGHGRPERRDSTVAEERPITTKATVGRVIGKLGARQCR